MFGVGPLYLFLLHNRLPVGFMRNGWLPWCSTMGTNLAIATMLALLIVTVGVRPFLWVYVPTVLIATAAGVWLFYVQHQFEDTYWAKGSAGTRTMLRSTEARTINYPPSSDGSRPTSECTKCITYRAAFRSIGCRKCSAITRVSWTSAVSPCAQASEAYSLPCGMKSRAGSSRSSGCGRLAGPARIHSRAAAIAAP